MTLSQTISILERVAMNQPTLNTVIGNDVFRLNHVGNARYGVFAWTQGIHRYDPATGVMRFAFTLFYVDRLTNAQDNQVEVQSVGIQTLANIVRVMEDEGFDVETPDFTTFNQRFTDECAGVFCNVTFETDAVSSCGARYEYEEGNGLLTAEGWQVIDVLGAKIYVRESL